MLGETPPWSTAGGEGRRAGTAEGTSSGPCEKAQGALRSLQVKSKAAWEHSPCSQAPRPGLFPREGRGLAQVTECLGGQARSRPEDRWRHCLLLHSSAPAPPPPAPAVTSDTGPGTWNRPALCHLPQVRGAPSPRVRFNPHLGHVPHVASAPPRDSCSGPTARPLVPLPVMGWGYYCRWEDEAGPAVLRLLNPQETEQPVGMGPCLYCCWWAEHSSLHRSHLRDAQMPGQV